MLQLLIVLFVSGVLASPELIEEKWYKEIVLSPRVKIIDSNGIEELIPETVIHRLPRRADTCKIPEKMEDSQLECKIYPSRVFCLQTCMFGYTFKEGIQRKMDCKFDEDRWTPVHKFENCQPFVDCTLTLGPGGKYKCHSNFMEKGNRCEVSCQHFEDMDAVPLQTYECNIEGEWSPELPFCARPGTGLRLSPPPSGARIAAEL